MIRPALVFLLYIPAFGQTLEPGSASVDRGSANFVRIALKTSPGNPILGLQFELSFPRSLEIGASDVVTGDAADTAGKSVTCVAQPPRAERNVCACILAGGRQALPAGIILMVKFGARADAYAGPVKLEVKKTTGVSAALKTVSIPNAEATITIR